MEKHKKVIVSFLVLLLALSSVCVIVFLVGGFDRFKNGCTKKDWANNNCVPAGHCGPEGSIVDQTIECEPKNYDSKFCHESLDVCRNTIY